MKTFNKTIFIIIMLLIPTVSFSQTLKATVYSVFGNSNKGTSLGVQLPGFIGDIEIGAFYNTSSVASANNIEQGKPVNSVTNTKGIYTSFSLVSVQKWDVSLGAKVGTAGDGVVISPSLGVDYYLNDRIGVGIDSRIEVMKPLIQGKLVFNVFGSQHRMTRQAKYAKNKEYFRVLRRNRY